MKINQSIIVFHNRWKWVPACKLKIDENTIGKTSERDSYMEASY